MKRGPVPFGAMSSAGGTQSDEHTREASRHVDSEADDAVPPLPSWLVDRPGDDHSGPRAPAGAAVRSGRRPERRHDVSRLRRGAQRCFSLTLTLALAAPLVAFATDVHVRVDGQTTALQTYARTVGQLIERLDVEVGDRDVIEPAVDRPLTADMTIDVHRAITVDVHVDGALVHRVVAPVASIAAVLEQAGLGQMRQVEARVSPTLASPIEDGGQVDVWLPREVQLAVDGEHRRLSTFARDVEELLDEEAIELGPHDRVSHAFDTPLTAVDRVVVARIQLDEEIEEIVIPHTVVREPSTEVWRGTTTVVQEGRDGVRYDRYRVVQVDGVQTERVLVSQQVAVEPEPRIVLVGAHVDWDSLARCESGGNWQMDAHGHLDPYSDARYYGGLQFNHRSWRAAGGLQYAYWPHEATREQQVATAERLFELRRNWGLDPWGGWPACSRRLGIR